MTFLEAALNILSREGKPLHFKDLTERALGKKLLTFVGRTPEVTMQTQLTAAVKKAPGNPFVRVKPGTFGLLRYPEMPPEAPVVEAVPPKAERGAERAERKPGEDGPSGEAGRGRRRRRRGGRGRDREETPRTGAASGTPSSAAPADAGGDDDGDEAAEPTMRGLSAEARAAALAATGVLEGDDESSGDDEGEESMSEGEDARSVAPAEAGTELDADLGDAPGVSAGAAGRDEAGGDDAGDDEGEEEGAEGGPAQAGAGGGALGEDGRRRRRRRRRRGGGADAPGEGGGRPLEASGDAAPAGEGSFSGGGEAGNGEPRATDAAIEAESQGPRRIMTPVDAAIEVLRGQAPGRGIAVRQIAETAVRRRLVHGEQNEAWRVMRAALAAEPRERLRAGQRPRIKAAGAGLFALARRPPDAEVERAELVFGEARRALRERTLASLERRIAELSPPVFEALARVLLQREGFGPATFVKRIEETIYVEALRGRGARPSKALIALRSGGTTAGRRAVGELRAGIGKRGQDEGLLMLGGRLDGEAISEWKKAVPPVEIADGQAMAEICIRHGIGVISANVSVDFVDADFFAELSEG
jgi:hypothetical protein